MALVHETLYRTKKYSEVDMAMYLEALAAQVASSYPGHDRIRIDVGAPGVTLDITRATPCGLIVTELITNAFKYAFPGSACDTGTRPEPCTVVISMTKNGNLYELAISDNGVGLPTEVDLRTAHSLGLKLVNFLSRHQLRATIEVRRDHGTEYVIRFGPHEARR